MPIPNKKADAALKQLIRRSNRQRPSFSASLLNQKWTRYIFYRLHTPLALTLVIVLISIFEYVYFFRVFSAKYTVLPLIAINLGGFFRSFHWGLLEELRDNSRNQNTKSNMRGAGGLWSIVTALISLIYVLLLLGSYFYFSRENAPIPTSAIVVTIALAVSFIGELFIQTWTGLLSDMRFRRPFVMLTGLEIFTPIMAVATHQFMPAWSVALSIFVAFCLRLIILARTTSTVGRKRQLPFSALKTKYWLHIPIRKEIIEAFHQTKWKKSCSAGIAMALERFGYIAALGIILGDPNSILAITFHLMSPAVNAASGWTRPFYYDFSHPKNYHWRTFMLSLEKNLSVTSLFVAMYCFVLAASPIVIYFPKTVWFTLLMIGPVILFLALIAPKILVYFTYQRYLLLCIFWSVILILAGVVSSRGGLGETNRFSILSVILISGYLLVSFFKLSNKTELGHGVWGLLYNFFKYKRHTLIKIRIFPSTNEPKQMLKIFDDENIIGSCRIKNHLLIGLKHNQAVRGDFTNRIIDYLSQKNIIPSDVQTINNATSSLKPFHIRKFLFSVDYRPHSGFELVNEWSLQLQKTFPLLCFLSQSENRIPTSFTNEMASAMISRLNAYLKEGVFLNTRDNVKEMPFIGLPLLEDGKIIAIILLNRPVEAEHFEYVQNEVFLFNLKSVGLS